MKKQLNVAGSLLVLAAITFWVSWLLMPDPGTTDTAHILSIVKRSRDAVICSVITQITSAVLYIIALFLLVKNHVHSRSTTTGVILIGIGAMGMCADAFFHLLAWFMTDGRVTIQKDVIRVMEFMQADALVLLIPLLLPFFIGCFFIALGLRRQGLVSKTPLCIFIAAIVIGIAGACLFCGRPNCNRASNKRDFTNIKNIDRG